MPRCAICKTQFYNLSWSSPSEHCDCGCNATSDYDDSEEYHGWLKAAREAWQRDGELPPYPGLDESEDR